ncbi:hypothetical protein QIH77_07510 [Bradyrhizobium diazoefficiens]|uniref:hypothetical protein n=1 Tax=Bradyrhizobium diazoefficiens TaxID=1355477 RepID=UPI00272CE281|nr:hypothetical protein [Bradyrhizobium diazoefficiens]WLA75035.1 hypothetical protein QIH77_07510 [Bradyrhizobium diazoefficiens]
MKDATNNLPTIADCSCRFVTLARFDFLFAPPANSATFGLRAFFVRGLISQRCGKKKPYPDAGFRALRCPKKFAGTAGLQIPFVV